MWNKNVETFLCCDKEFEEAKTVLYGAPFDSTTSYRPGSRFGSSAIRRESYGIESYSPYQDKDLEDCPVFDSGDMELPLGDASLSLAQIEERAGAILDAGKRPFLLGGEHLVTLGAFRAVFERCPQVHILHFDAHADLRDDYLGVKLSHACVLRRCWEFAATGRFSSSAFAPETGRSSAGGRTMCPPTSLTWKGWRRPWPSWGTPPCISPWT